MHEQRRSKAVDLAEILLGVISVIDDRSVDSVAHGRQEGHQPSKAIAEYGNLAAAFLQLGHNVGGVLNVPGAGGSVIGLTQAKAMLPVSLGGDAKVKARFLALE